MNKYSSRISWFV